MVKMIYEFICNACGAVAKEEYSINMQSRFDQQIPLPSLPDFWKEVPWFPVERWTGTPVLCPVHHVELQVRVDGKKIHDGEV